MGFDVCAGLEAIRGMTLDGYDRTNGLNSFARSDGRGGDSWRTPPKLLRAWKQEFQLSDYDPCPISEGLRSYDGLQETPDNVVAYFMNPPYSQKEPWLKRAQVDQAKGKLVVVLLPVDTSTIWFHEHVYGKADLRFLRGRLAFKRSCKICSTPKNPVDVFYIEGSFERGVDLYHCAVCKTDYDEDATHPEPAAFPSMLAIYRPYQAATVPASPGPDYR